MSSSELTVGFVAAGAALAGVLLTLLGEAWRHRWEDRRRWADVERQAMREFLLGSRTLYSHVRLVKAIQFKTQELQTAMDEMSRQLEAGTLVGGKEKHASLSGAVAAQAEALAKAKGQVDSTWERLNEAAADIVILCSQELQDLASAHQHLIMKIHRQDSQTLPAAAGSKYLTEIDSKVRDSQEDLRAQMRKDLRITP